MVTVREEMHKGPWTEQEDTQLVCTVHLLGDRRWDSIAQVSGLNRTGKSCRMRWVNYLHPGLKQGRLSPHEERLVIELHARWGNSWSRIARRLPGRTDHDIKNYWKTRMRTKAQERGRETSTSSPSSSSFSLTSYQSCSCLLDSAAPVDGMIMSCGDTSHIVNFNRAPSRLQSLMDSPWIRFGGRWGHHCSRHLFPCRRALFMKQRREHTAVSSPALPRQLRVPSGKINALRCSGTWMLKK